MQTSKQTAALIVCRGEVGDPPWAAVQHRGRGSSSGKSGYVHTINLVKGRSTNVRHYNDMQQDVGATRV